MHVYALLAGIFVFSVLVGMSPVLIRSVVRRRRMRDRKCRLLVMCDLAESQVREHRAELEAILRARET